MSDSHQSTSPPDLHWRVQDLERRVEERLRSGAATFDKLWEAINTVRDEAREQIDALKPKPMPAWKILAALAGVAIFVGTLIWQAARYPDRDEYNDVRGDVGTIKIEQAQIRTVVEGVRESQTRIEHSQTRLERALRGDRDE